MFNRLKKINKNQKGFTLIELIIVIAITGLIISAIAATIFQLFNISDRSDSHMLAVRQVQNAGYWVSHDVQMANKKVAPAVDPDADGFPLWVTWEDWDTTLHEVTYTLLENGELERSHSVNGETSEILVAQYINLDPAKTKCEFTDTNEDGINDTLFLTVTATVTGWHEASETRVYEIVPRPEQPIVVT